MKYEITLTKNGTEDNPWEAIATGKGFGSGCALSTSPSSALQKIGHVIEKNMAQDDSDLEGEEVIHNSCGLEDGKCESCQ